MGENTKAACTGYCWWHALLLPLPAICSSQRHLQKLSRNSTEPDEKHKSHFSAQGIFWTHRLYSCPQQPLHRRLHRRLRRHPRASRPLVECTTAEDKLRACAGCRTCMDRGTRSMTHR